MEEERASAFINRLLSNPALQSMNALQKEEQILQFLRINPQTLLPTLSSADFFPGKSWSEIFSIIYNRLIECINSLLYKEIEQVLSSIDFSFIAALREQGIGIPNIKGPLADFQKELLKKPDARRSFSGALTALLDEFMDKYLEQVFYRREYIYFELVKVEKLKMSKDEIKNLLKASLFLRNTVNLMTVSHDRQGIGVVQASFIEKVVPAARERLMVLPYPLIESSLKSNISFPENPTMPTTSRLVAIFSFRCQNYRNQQTVERGADTQDKSWFAIARRNYKYYGFDLKMLDELYKTAAENGW